MKNKAVDPQSHVFKNAIGTQKAYTAEEIKTLCTARGIEFQPGDEENVVEFVASDEKADREGDVMQMDGMDATDFLTNPQFLYVHDYGSITIGNVIRLSVDKSDITNAKLLILVLFQTVTDEAKDLCALAKKGVIRAVSIGFRAKQGGIKYPTEAEREALNMRPGGVIFLSWELFEVSLCPIGMNPRALKKAHLHKKTIAMLEKQNASIFSHEEEIDMTPAELKQQMHEVLKDTLTALGKQFEDVALFTASIKSGDKVTSEHVAAIHDGHGFLSKALTHMGKVMEDHPTLLAPGETGGVFTDAHAKSLTHAVENCGKAIVNMKMVGSSHTPDEPAAGDDDGDENKALIDFAKRHGYVVEEKNIFETANERLSGATA